MLELSAHTNPPCCVPRQLMRMVAKKTGWTFEASFMLVLRVNVTVAFDIAMGWETWEPTLLDRNSRLWGMFPGWRMPA